MILAAWSPLLQLIACSNRLLIYATPFQPPVLLPAHSFAAMLDRAIALSGKAKEGTHPVKATA
jgi:hypothetical protein